MSDAANDHPSRHRRLGTLGWLAMATVTAAAAAAAVALPRHRRGVRH